MKLRTYLPIILTIFTLLGLSGCQSLETRGQFVSDESIAEINKERFNKQEVVAMIGLPTYIPDYNKNTWYYMHRSVIRRAWFNQNVQDQRIIKIVFAENKAQKAELLTNTHNENIVAHGDYTKTLGTEKTAIQSFVKNLARFNKNN